MSLSLLLRSYDFIKSITDEDLSLMARLIKMKVNLSKMETIELSGIVTITKVRIIYYALMYGILNPFTSNVCNIIDHKPTRDYHNAIAIVRETITGDRSIRCIGIPQRDQRYTIILNKTSDTSYVGEKIYHYITTHYITTDRYIIECHLIDNIAITCYIRYSLIIVQPGYPMLTLYKDNRSIEDESAYSLQMITAMKMMIEKYWK